MVQAGLYKINLRSLSDGEHVFTYDLDDDYFAEIDAEITAGDVSAEVTCIKRAEVFKFHIALEGYVVVACDRCLDDVEIDIETERNLVVKYGAEYCDDDDEILIIPERDGVLDLRWMLYEEIALSLPLQRSHEEGQCNDSMMQIYDSLVTEELPQGEDGAIAQDDNGANQQWLDALQKLRKN